MRELVLIDFSAIAVPIWAMSASDPDPNATSQKIVARVRANAHGAPAVAICCDSGKSFRHELDANYKAQRPDKLETFRHQVTLALEELKKDGFTIWTAPGFEADDVIATATWKVIEGSDTDAVLIVTQDKDLMQLVQERVRVKNSGSGDILDGEGVAAKFGVLPIQMGDYLALVGDTSDNIKGCEGVGAKRAQAFLAKFGSIAAFYEALDRDGAAKVGLSPAAVKSLTEFRTRWPLVAQLIALRPDVPLPGFEAVWQARVAQPLVAVELDGGWGEDDAAVEEVPPAPPPPAQAPVQASVLPFEARQPGPEASAAPEPAQAATTTFGPNSSAPVSLPPEPGRIEVLPPTTPVEWERQLDPRSLADAQRLAVDMFNSRLFSAIYGTKEAILSTMMVGRELGIPALASLRSIHIIENKHALSADLMVGLILKSGLAEFFEPLSFSAEAATFETQRKGGRKPIQVTYTTAMAQAAGLIKPNSGWAKDPTAQCMARAKARLARLVYPDLLAGLYTPEELADARESA